MKHINMKSKTVIVTGASRGLGRYLCLHYANLGANVAAFARNEEDLKALAEEAAEKNGILRYYGLSVNDFDAVSYAVQDIIGNWGKIDVLINNAGVIKAATPFDTYSIEDMEAEIETNLKGSLFVTRAVSPHMIKEKEGYIINISSVGGTRGAKLPGSEVYIATKFGVNGFYDALSKYLIDYNVHVATLCPGGIDTTIWERNEYRHGSEKSLLIQKSEMADMIDFILSQRNEILFSRATFYPAPEAPEW